MEVSLIDVPPSGGTGGAGQLRRRHAQRIFLVTGAGAGVPRSPDVVDRCHAHAAQHHLGRLRRVLAVPRLRLRLIACHRHDSSGRRPSVSPPTPCGPFGVRRFPPPGPKGISNIIWLLVAGLWLAIGHRRRAGHHQSSTKAVANIASSRHLLPRQVIIETSPPPGAGPPAAQTDARRLTPQSPRSRPRGRRR